MSGFTELQLKGINMLREKLRDLDLDEEQESDGYLLKWLQAQNFDVNRAEEMLRKSLKWRKEFQIDSVMEWTPPPTFKKAFPSELCGYDRDGNAVVIIPMRYFDPSFFGKIEKRDYVNYRIQYIEKILQGMRDRNKTEGTSGNQVVTIHDFEGFNIRSVLSSKPMDYLKEVGRLIDENYPEITKSAYVTYAPRMITFAISIAKPFLPKGALSKSKIYGYNKEIWGPEILEHIPSHVLPPRYGGSNFEFERTAFADQLLTKVPET